MVTVSLLRRQIASHPRRIWIFRALFAILLFLIALLSFIVFYFRIYIPSLKEETFVNQNSCVIIRIQTSPYSCNRQQKTCQLFVGKHFIGNTTVNIPLYSTWYDYETSSGQCTFDPCTNSQSETFYVNQVVLSAYWSSYSERAYLNLTAKLDSRQSKMVIFLLLSLINITYILSIILLVIVALHNKYKRIIYPIDLPNSKQSTRMKPPLITIEKVPSLDYDDENQISNDSPSSTRRPVTPAEITSIQLVVFEPHRISKRKTLPPLPVVTSPLDKDDT